MKTEIEKLCKELSIDPKIYENVKQPGRLIFVLSEYCVFRKGEIKAGRILPPNPEDFMEESNGKK